MSPHWLLILLLFYFEQFYADKTLGYLKYSHTPLPSAHNKLVSSYQILNYRLSFLDPVLPFFSLLVPMGRCFDFSVNCNNILITPVKSCHRCYIHLLLQTLVTMLHNFYTVHGPWQTAKFGHSLIQPFN